MIKLNRTTEYGLMALRHMSRKQSSASAREISDAYGLPFEITAKTLQRLKDTGLIQSVQGARGGYTVAKDLSTVDLVQFLEFMEGAQSVVACQTAGGSAEDCQYKPRCDIKHLLGHLNLRVLRFLSSIRLSELVEGSALDQWSMPVALSIMNPVEHQILGEEP
jgi:Rrf2 family protein